MDINENNQLINTFTHGMNTDISDALINSNQYRYAENVRTITDTENNTGELHLIEGNTELSWIGSNIKAMTSIRNKLIVITKNDYIYVKDLEYSDITNNLSNSSILGIILNMNQFLQTVYRLGYSDALGYNENIEDIYGYTDVLKTVEDIYESTDQELILGSETGESFYEEIWESVNGYIDYETFIRSLSVIDDNESSSEQNSKYGWNLIFKPEEGESFGEYLSLVTRWENDNLIKLYIADGKHSIMYINVADSSDGTIVGIDNIITESDTILEPIQTQINYDNGSIKGFKLQYAYRLYKLGGDSSTLSILSNQVVLYENNYNVGYDTAEDTVSKQSVTLTIPEYSDTKYDKILIYRIAYLLQGQNPEVYMIYDDSLITNYIDTGSPNTQTSVSFTEFLSYIDVEVRPKIIESKGNYLYAANISDVVDDIDKYYEDFDARSYSSGDYEDGDGYKYNHQFDTDNILTWNSEFWKTEDASNFGGTGKYINWKYDIKSVFIDLQNNKYTSVDDFINNNPIENTQLKSLMRGEIYRYGAILYNNKGQHSSVKWIADIMIPYTVIPEIGNHSEVLLIPKFYEDDYIKNNLRGKYLYEMKQIGIKFNINFNLIEEDGYDCAGIEIVRCLRTESDRITLLLGFGSSLLDIYASEKDRYIIGNQIRIEDCKISSTHINSAYLSLSLERKHTLCSSGIMSTNAFFITGDCGIKNNSLDTENKQGTISNFAVSSNKYLMLASPEYSYGGDIEGYINGKNIYVDYIYNNILETKYTDVGCHSMYEDTNIYNPMNMSSQIPLYTIKSEFEVFDHQLGFNINNIIYRYLLNDEYTKNQYSFKEDEIYLTISQESIDRSIATLHSGYAGALYLIDTSITSGNSGYCFNAKTPSMSACRPLLKPQLYTYPNNKYAIDGVLCVDKNGYESGKWNSLFDENGVYLGDDDVEVFLKTLDQYVKWSVPLIYNNDKAIVDNKYLGLNKENFWKVDSGDTYKQYPIGYSGKCIILHSSEKLPIFGHGDLYNDCAILKEVVVDSNSELGPETHKKTILDPVIVTPTINLRSRNTVPYGGKYKIKNSQYVSYGNYIPKENNTEYSIFDGDTFPGIFTYNVSTPFHDFNCTAAVTQSTIYSVPIESGIDLSATFGDLITMRDKKGTGEKSYSDIYTQDYASNIVVGNINYNQTKNAYLYNTAYSYNNSAIPYESIEYTNISTGLYDTRVIRSNYKENGDTIDGWLNFSKTNDYIDVDTRYGQITNMRLFKDKMLFWQENATGILSIEDRTILNDAENNDIFLGTGKALDRYDYVSTTYGMKPNQYEAEIQSDLAQYWWDGTNKEILQYSQGMELTPLAKTKGVINYINTHNESDHPSLSYSKKYNEILANVVNNEAIIYNDQAQEFISVYKFTPIHRANINNMLILANNNSIYLQDYSTSDNAYLFGTPIYPLVQYVINPNSQLNKVYDVVTFGGRFYGGSEILNDNKYPLYIKNEHKNTPMNNLTFKFKTPLKQESSIKGGSAISINEYDFRLTVPRNGDNTISTKDTFNPTIHYGNRMRGKTMQCELSSSSNSTDFSLQYITTKFRMSWS